MRTDFPNRSITMLQYLFSSGKRSVTYSLFPLNIEKDDLIYCSRFSFSSRYYSIFKYINLIALTQVNAIFCNYRNINFLKYPISLLPIIVYILGADVMIHIGANPFLSVNILFNNFFAIQTFLPVAVLCLIAFNCLKKYCKNLQYS